MVIKQKVGVDRWSLKMAMLGEEEGESFHSRQTLDRTLHCKTRSAHGAATPR